MESKNPTLPRPSSIHNNNNNNNQSVSESDKNDKLEKYILKDFGREGEREKSRERAKLDKTHSEQFDDKGEGDKEGDKGGSNWIKSSGHWVPQSAIP